MGRGSASAGRNQRGSSTSSAGSPETRTVPSSTACDHLVQAAAGLHIHRNTLVYRPGKIARVTGRPVRDHRATPALYVASLADQLHDAG